MSTNLPANLSNLVTAMEETSRSVGVDAGDQPFLRLLKTGDWVYGADDVDVEAGSEWAINIHSISRGFAAWKKGSLEGEEMALITEPPIAKGDLEDVGAQWKAQIGFQLACVSGDDEGQNVLFKTTSYGGTKAAKAIIDAVLKEVKDGSTALTPVVTLEKDSYKHKEYGTVFNPIFEIVAWANEAGDITDVEEEKEAPKQVEEKPKSSRRSKPAKEESTENEANDGGEAEVKPRRSRRIRK